MTTATEVSGSADLLGAIAGVSPTGYTDREEIIIVKNSFTLGSAAVIKRKITIVTDNPDGVTITRESSYPGALFSLGASGALTFGRPGDPPESLVIDGDESVTNATSPLIDLSNSGAILIMNDGVHLTNNKNTSSDGGRAVKMTNGKFIMNGGKISGNSTTGNGGGICVDSTDSVSFTMNGGSITENETTSTSGVGGGVYFSASGGSFEMSGGSIAGNEATGPCGGFYLASTTSAELPANVENLIFCNNDSVSSTPNFYNNAPSYTTVGGIGWSDTWSPSYTGW
jgi:hypothetical protein